MSKYLRKNEFRIDLNPAHRGKPFHRCHNFRRDIMHILPRLEKE